MLVNVLFFLCAISHFVGTTSALSSPPKIDARRRIQQDAPLVSRAEALRIGFFTAHAVLLGPTVAQAAEEKTVYLSGKTPKVPGAKPKDKNDLSGTKKDPNFLRSIADCKSQCESKGKLKEDCLSECQDICCTTYEQYVFHVDAIVSNCLKFFFSSSPLKSSIHFPNRCTFNIVPRI